MDEAVYVYDVTELEEVMFNETNPTGSVTVVFKLPTGKLVGVKLQPEILADLEVAFADIRRKLAGGLAQ